MPKTLKQAAETALFVQDACNLSGVLRSMTDIVFETLWPIAHETGKGTDWVNQHPIVSLFLSKLSSLNRTQGDEIWFSRVYDEVDRLAHGELAEEKAA